MEEGQERSAPMLDPELMPLRAAADAAYAEIIGGMQPAAGDVALVCIALSTLSPIYFRGFPLTLREVQERLFRPQPDLEELHIRRRDMRAAIATLKEARGAFD